MRSIICVAATAALFASSTQLLAKHAPFQLNKTTWTYTYKGKHVRESIDSDGNFISQNRAGKQVDNGTAVMKDGKACFTSAVTKDGEVCWTAKSVAVGQSMVTHSDKGEKLKVTRVKYVAMTSTK